MLVGEADVPLSEAAEFFGDGDQLNLVFNFLLDNDIFLALADRRGRADRPVPEGAAVDPRRRASG